MSRPSTRFVRLSMVSSSSYIPRVSFVVRADSLSDVVDEIAARSMAGSQLHGVVTSLLGSQMSASVEITSLTGTSGRVPAARAISLREITPLDHARRIDDRQAPHLELPHRGQREIHRIIWKTGVHGFAHRLGGGEVHGRQPAARRHHADIPVSHQSNDLPGGADDRYKPQSCSRIMPPTVPRSVLT